MDSRKQSPRRSTTPFAPLPPEFPTTSPRRRTLAAVLLFAMTVLAALAGTGHGPPVWIAGLAAWGAAVLLWPQLARAQKRQALLLAGVGVVAFGVALGRGGSPSLLGLLTQNTALLGMLAAGNRSLSGVLLQPPSARNNPSHIHQGGADSDQGDSDQQQVAAA